LSVVESERRTGQPRHARQQQNLREPSHAILLLLVAIVVARSLVGAALRTM
jgi:hypothetical protein